MREYKSAVGTAKVGFQTGLVYKGNFHLSLLSGLISLFVQIIFWSALFKSRGSYRVSASSTIGGYSFQMILTYYLLVYLLTNGISTNSLGYKIKDDIMTGRLNIHILRPYRYLTNSIIYTISQRIVVFSLSLLTFVILLLKFNSLFVAPQNNHWPFVIFAVILSYTISFLISSIIGMASFWLLETSSLHVVLRGLTLFLSGAFFPLDFLGGVGGLIIKYLPFSYLVFFPTQIYLSDYPINLLIFDSLVGIGWVVILATIVNKMWKSGSRRYSSFGG